MSSKVTDPALLSEMEPPSVVVDAASIEKLESVTVKPFSWPSHDSRLSEVPPSTVRPAPSANVTSSSVTDPALLSKMEPRSVIADAEKLESVTLSAPLTATKRSVKLPRCCTTKPPAPQDGGCGSEASSPLTLTRWPGRTTSSISMPTF